MSTTNLLLCAVLLFNTAAAAAYLHGFRSAPHGRFRCHKHGRRSFRAQHFPSVTQAGRLQRALPGGIQAQGVDAAAQRGAELQEQLTQ